jgi:hypothetical protein
VVLDRIAAVLEPAYVEELDTLPMEELRSRRAECQELEEVLSYVRRVVQARLDIVLAELEHRESGTEAGLADLVARLPEILGERRGAPSTRLASYRDPAATSAELLARVDAVVGDDALARLADLDQRVQWLAGALAELERSFSDGRRNLHQHLDALQAEIVRRYKTGEVTVEEVLRAPR